MLCYTGHRPASAGHWLAHKGLIPTTKADTKEERDWKFKNNNSNDDATRVAEDNADAPDPKRRNHNSAIPIWVEDETSNKQVEKRPEVDVKNQDTK